MRVIAGQYRSRLLKSLRGPLARALRPTSDRLRETLFNILGPAVEGSIFVDVYAGTGAVGIEALSRGAREVIFIEHQAAAIRLIESNLSRLGIGTGAEIVAEDAVRGLDLLARRHLHAQFVFLDPPYAEKVEYRRALDFLDAAPILMPAGRVIVEHSKRWALPERLQVLERTRVIEQGDAALTFYRLALAA